MVSGPACFLTSLGLLLVPCALLPFALPLPLLVLAGAVARPEPAMPLADGADLLFLPMLLRLHQVTAFVCKRITNKTAHGADRPPAFDSSRMH